MVVTHAVGPARILFVDDDLLIADSTVDLLKDLVNKVIEAHSAMPNGAISVAAPASPLGRFGPLRRAAFRACWSPQHDE